MLMGKRRGREGPSGPQQKSQFFWQNFRATWTQGDICSPVTPEKNVRLLRLASCGIRIAVTHKDFTNDHTK